MKCPKCGNEIANDSVFCEYCGTRITKENQQIKKVDVRWCLLPAMAIATIAMGFAAESWDIYLFHGCDHNVMPFFIIPSCLFVVSCWCGIKRIVPPSFVIIIVILFSINYKILWDSENARNVHKWGVHITWSSDDDVYESGLGGIHLETYFDYYIKNDQKAREDLLEYAAVLKEKLIKEEGKDCVEESFYTETEYYTGWKGYEVFFYISIFLLVYLTYAILAYKKKWKF